MTARQFRANTSVRPRSNENKERHQQSIRLSMSFGCFQGYLTQLGVELEGIEPSSKRGNHVLSTCLSLPLIFVCKQDQSHQLAPYPLKLRLWREAANSYLRFCSTTISTSFGKTAFGWCLVSAPCAEIKLIYCASIKQRERNCFRQLILCMIDI